MITRRQRCCPADKCLFCWGKGGGEVLMEESSSLAKKGEGGGGLSFMEKGSQFLKVASKLIVEKSTVC